MSRWLSLVAGAAVAALFVSGCNSPKCGPGTKQVQVSGGGIQCQPVDFQASGIVCDADAGATIVGDKCVSSVTCGANTKLTNGVCVGTGGGGDGGFAPACAAPATGKICVSGAIRDFLTNNVSTSAKIHVALYNPLDFIQGRPAIASTDVDSGVGGYVFQDVTPPGLGLIAVVAGDADLENGSGGAGVTFVSAASGAQNVAAGNIYVVDVYALLRSTVNGWANSGTDWYTSGGYVSKFYSDAKPDPTMLSATETHPVSGVSVSEPSGTGNPVDMSSLYFSTDLSTINKSLTATTAVGAAISPPPAGNITTFSGSGGVDGSGNPITWETQSGGSAAHIIFISRFHPN